MLKRGRGKAGAARVIEHDDRYKVENVMAISWGGVTETMDANT
jgi:hypothetical protein